MAGIPIPKACFLHSLSHKVIGAEKRWYSVDGKRIYTWDALHGEVEVFDFKGRHIGVMNCHEETIKPLVKGRRIYVG